MNRKLRMKATTKKTKNRICNFSTKTKIPSIQWKTGKREKKHRMENPNPCSFQFTYSNSHNTPRS